MIKFWASLTKSDEDILIEFTLISVLFSEISLMNKSVLDEENFLLKKLYWDLKVPLLYPAFWISWVGSICISGRVPSENRNLLVGNLKLV